MDPLATLLCLIDDLITNRARIAVIGIRKFNNILAEFPQTKKQGKTKQKNLSKNLQHRHLGIHSYSVPPVIRWHMELLRTFVVY